MYIIRQRKQYFSCNGLMAANLLWNFCLFLKNTWSVQTASETKMLVYPEKKLVVILAKACHQVAIYLPVTYIKNYKPWNILCFRVLFLELYSECGIGHLSENSRVNTALGSAFPSVPVSVQTWSSTSALSLGEFWVIQFVVFWYNQPGFTWKAHCA